MGTKVSLYFRGSVLGIMEKNMKFVIFSKVLPFVAIGDVIFILIYFSLNLIMISFHS